MIYHGDNYHHCLECKCAINYDAIVTQGKWGYYCQQCSERKNMNEPQYPLCGDCIHYNGRIHCNAKRFAEGKHDLAICPDFRKKTMPNIKITAEIDGKQVPLNTISDETFKQIKALEKPKEIPVARVGNFHGYPSDKRLFLKITDSIRENVVNNNINMIAINLKNGCINNTWRDVNEDLEDLYENVKPL